MSKLTILSTLFPIILVLDQWTKHLVHSRFARGESIIIIKDLFSLTYVQNRGAAFGILNNANPAFRDRFFLIIPIVAAIALIFLFWKLPKKEKLLSTSLTLILSGALGNFLDRLKYGFVVDFLDFYWKNYHWPAFNVADSCIVVGVGLWIYHSYRYPPHRTPTGQQL